MKIEDLKPTEQKSSKTLACPVSEKTYSIISLVARRSDVTISNILRHLVSDFIEENKDYIESILINDESPKSLPQTGYTPPQGL